MATASKNKQDIFLIDDEPGILKTVARTLEYAGYKVRCFSRAADCLEQLRYQSCDLLITDVKMPEMNGIEATKEIRKISKNLPIIAQTAYIFEDDKDIILEAGCDACLIKPIRKDHLFSVMSGFIKSN